MISLRSLIEDTIVTRDVGVDRIKLPQIAQEHIPEFMNFLRECGVCYKKGKISADKLTPIQNELNLDKVESLVANVDAIKEQPILISKNGVILDGHHRWAALKQTNTPITVLKIDAGPNQVRDLMNVFDKSFKREITEDWMFEPQNFGILPTSTLGHVKQKDNAMPKYKKTKDAGTKKTNKMTKKYYRKNRAFARGDALATDREFTYNAP